MTNLQSAYAYADRGFMPLILAPLTKFPAHRDYFNLSSRDHTVIAKRYQDTVRYAAWVESHRADDFAEFRDEDGNIPDDKSAVIAASRVDDYTAFEPNVGLYIGASQLVVVDVDSPQEYEAWLSICEAHDFDPGAPTVQSPGSFRNGTWVHSDGGHWYFQATEELAELLSAHRALSNERFDADGFVSTKNVNGRHLPAFMTNKRIAVTPPSQRVEGFYNGSLDTIPALPKFLLTAAHAHVKRAADVASRKPKLTSAENPDFINWEANIDITELLDGWTLSGSDGECDVLERPDASSGRSAVVHVPHCRHVQVDTAHRLVTFHTVTRPDWVEGVLAGRDTCAVSTLYAAKHFDGSVAALKRALGFPTTYHTEWDTPPSTATAPTAPPRRVLTMSLSSRTRPARQLATPAHVEVVASSTPALHTAPAIAEEVVSPPAEPEPVEVSVQVEDTTEIRPLTDDVWIPEPYEGNPPTWTERNPLAVMYTLLAGVAVSPPASTYAYLADCQAHLSQPAALGANDDQMRSYHIGNWKTRTQLHAKNRVVTTEQIATRLNIEPWRARAWMRALIPYADARGLVVRERTDESTTKRRAAEWDAANPKARCPLGKLPSATVDTAWLVFKAPTTEENEQ